MLILDDKKVLSNFLDSISSKATKESYSYSLRKFMVFLKLTNYSDLLKIDVYESVKSFILYLKTKGYSTRTIKTKVFAIKSFYEMNDMEDIKWRKVMKFKGEDTPIHEDRGYTHEEINQILNVCDLRTKAAILLMASSGMRVGALPALTLRQLSNMTVTVYARTESKYITFITPECRKALDDYLDYRVRCGEKLSPDSPLLRKDFNAGLARLKVELCTEDSLMKSIWKKLVSSGLREIDHFHSSRKEVKASHGFRKFFETQLINSDVKESVVKKLMGHASDLTSLYYKPTEEFLYEEYSKAIDALTIDPSKRLQRKVELLTVEKSKIDLALSEIAEMKKTIGL